MVETTVWGIHAGRTGDAEPLFFGKHLIAIGWSKVGDLSRLAKSRDAYKAAVAKAYPEGKPGAIPVYASQLFRFVHEARTGDIVVYSSKADRQVHFGRFESEYQFRPDVHDEYCNTRAVKWLKAVPRTAFTQGALYELGSAMTLFQIRNNADEYLALLEGKPAPIDEVDDTGPWVAENIDQITQDYVLKRLGRELKGHPLAHFVAHLLGAMDYRVRISPEGPDGGVDVIAHRDELGFEPPIIKVQVKSSEGNVGEPTVAALYGQVGQGEFGLLVTLGGFTNQARSFARGKSNLRLIDGAELVDLVLQHYEQFDSSYKGLLPLRRVYVPEALGEPDQPA